MLQTGITFKTAKPLRPNDFPLCGKVTADWRDLSASEITQRVTNKVQSGSICLFHNAVLHTPEALPSILDFFQSSGYKVVPISEIILTGEYSVKVSPGPAQGEKGRTKPPLQTTRLQGQSVFNEN